jgi:hypothetical protein
MPSAPAPVRSERREGAALATVRPPVARIARTTAAASGESGGRRSCAMGVLSSAPHGGR